MSDKKTSQETRAVKTLLLCKVELGNDENFKNLYAGGSEKFSAKKENTDEAHPSAVEGPVGGRYFALGDYDAFSIYDTCKDPKGNKWLAEVYNDRLRVSHEAGHLYSYNPIHLVSVTEQNATSPFGKAYCAATLIYGWKGAPGDEATKTGTEPDAADKNESMEKRIVSAVNGLRDLHKLENDEEPEFLVFQAVNICDAVILWFSDNYANLCRRASSLMQYGYARKTYSIIGAKFGVDGGKPKILSQAVEKLDVHIRGSIQDLNNTRNWLKASIKKARSGGTTPSSHNQGLLHFLTGSFDFVEEIEEANISVLLQHLMESNTAEPFWDLHTDVITKEEPAQDNRDSSAGSEGGKPSAPALTPEHTPAPEPTTKDVNTALHKLYDNFKSHYKKQLSLSKTTANAEDWPFSYHELLGVTAGIEQNPVLRTPSYLMFDFLRISEEVFKRAEKTDKDTYHIYQKILRYSQESIKKVIHSWNQLIDQTIRTDEMVLKGICFVSSIYNSVPVQLVDFYNSFINNFVHSIIEDGKDGREKIPDPQPRYAFLLLPNQSRQIGITPLFNTEKYRADMVNKKCMQEENSDFPEHKNCALCPDNRDKTCWCKCCWPPEQVYQVEFPTDALFKPTELITSLSHEVFHIFGDQFRCREERWKLIGQAAIRIFLKNLHIDSSTKIYNSLDAYLQEKLNVKGGFKFNSPHMDESVDFFSIRLSNLLNAPTPMDAFQDVPGDNWKYYLRTKTMTDRWSVLRNDFSIMKNPVWTAGFFQEMDQFTWFLKECFADYCAFLVLRIDLREYYTALDRGIDQSNGSEAVQRMLERGMLMTVAWIKSKNGNKDLRPKEKKTSANYAYHAFMKWTEDVCYNFRNILKRSNISQYILKRFRFLAGLNREISSAQPDQRSDSGLSETAQKILSIAYDNYQVDSSQQNAKQKLLEKMAKDNGRKLKPSQDQEDENETLEYFMESYLELIVLEYLKKVNKKWNDRTSKVLDGYADKYAHLIRNEEMFTQSFINEINDYHKRVDMEAEKICKDLNQ